MADNKLNLFVKFTGIDKLSGSIKNIVGSSKAGTRAIRDLESQARDLKKQIKGVGRDIAGSSGNITNLINKENRLEAELAAVNRQLEVQKTKLERVSNIQSRASRVAGIAGKAGAAASVAMTAPLIAFGKQAVEAASDAYELQSAFDVTFGNNAAMMTAWAEKTGAAMGRSKVEIEQAANTFGIFFNQADPKKSAAMSQQFAVLAQDLSSFYNVDPGTALDKLRSGLTGESEPLRDFGVFMTEAAVKAQALKMGLKPVGKEFTEQQKILARANLIMEATTKAQGDVVRTGGSTANQMRAANAAWQDMSVTIGQELLPAITPAIQTITGMIKSFSNMSPTTRKWVVLLGVGAAAIGPLLLGIAGIATAIGALAPIVGAIGLPFLAVAAAIGVVAYLIYANWDKIKAAFNTGVEWMKGVFAALPDWMKNIGSMMMQGLLMSLNPALLVTKLIGIAKSGVTAFKNYFGIKSPSRLFMEMGGHINDGLGIGLERGQGRPMRAVGKMAGAVAGAGALALSPAASARAPTPAATGKVEIHVHQQPGEDSEALARRVAELVEKAKAQKDLRSYGDEF